MRKIYLILIVLLFPFGSFAATQESIIIAEHPWARPTMGGLHTTAVYMTLRNQGKGSDVLVAVSTPLATHAAIHSTVTRGSVMRMIPMDNLSIPAGKNVVFSPGGLHIMLTGVRRPLQRGDRFPLMLHFEKSGNIIVRVTVE